MGIANYRKGPYPSLAVATSANGTDRDGAAIDMSNVCPGTLSFHCTTTIVTGSVVATYKVQVSRDGTNYYDLKPINNAAYVTMTASGAMVIPVDHAASGWNWVRIRATLSGAATAAGDTTLVAHQFVDVKLATS